MVVHESAEMYLETILILSHKSSKVRSIDIVEQLDYKKSSVSVAMKKLRENGFINMDPEGIITLTEKGKKSAESVYEKHMLFSEWLIHLGVDRDTAVKDACRIEHVISPESFEAIKEHVKDMNMS